MKGVDSKETIVAISTAIGPAAIGIVRMSGPESIPILKKIFSPSAKINKFAPYHLYHGFIKQNKEIIDEVMVSTMFAPHSYTGEDMVEIYAHGGSFILAKILDVCIQKGARLALAGEFTERAFLNGKMDLSKAEAVSEIIQAQSETELKIAASQLKGELAEKIENLSKKLLELIANLEVRLDYPDEEIEVISRKQLASDLEKIAKEIELLSCSFSYGNAIKKGIKTVIIGKPNVGKSSLLNVLLKKERVIVTPYPGTTRDAIEEILEIKGIPIRIVDTAGIRNPQSKIEFLSINKTREYLKEAELVLLVLDVSIPLREIDFSLLKECKNKKTILVINKIDRPNSWDENDLPEFSQNFVKVKTSTIKKEGISKLQENIFKLVNPKNGETTQGIIITNIRHKNLLEHSLKNLKSALKLIRKGDSEEIIAVFLRDALAYLDKITGKQFEEKVLEEIFSHFCVGK